MSNSNEAQLNLHCMFEAVSMVELKPYQKLYRESLLKSDYLEMKSNLVTYIELLIELDEQATAVTKPQGDIVESNTEN